MSTIRRIHVYEPDVTGSVPDHPVTECRMSWCGVGRTYTDVQDAPDAINHPEYYGGGDNPYEAIKVIQAWELDFELGSALKYIARAGKKTPSATTDLEKAIRYLQFELEKLERGQ